MARSHEFNSRSWKFSKMFRVTNNIEVDEFNFAFVLNSNLLGDMYLILPHMTLSAVVLVLMRPLTCKNEF